MFKLLAMLLAFLLVALVLLGLRQRRLELTSESAAIYGQIREQDEKLLDLKVLIAGRTNPPALADALARAGMDNGGVMQPRVTNVRTAPPAVETDLTHW